MNALENFENSFKSIVEVSPNAIILIDINGIIIYLNKIAENLFQFSRDELTGKILETIIPNRFRKCHPSYRQHFIHKEETRAMGKGLDLFAIRKDGTEFPVEVGLNQVQIGNKKFVLASVIDITERKKIDQEIINQNKKLAELSNQLYKTNKVLQKKNKDLNESIQYARNIQYSILPNIDDIANHLNDFCVYFTPKNIIGGDFYWFYQIENTSYIAVIDCTGHSVPGAMISMVIYSLLNEILIKNPMQTTGNILSNLHSNLYLFLQQEKGEPYSQDGCDISLCKLDNEKRLLQYSGARQDIYICKQNSIEIIKATQKSIGGSSISGRKEPERQYETINIPLSNDMTLIMTTDGILDQLNDKDEVFGNKHLFEMIRTNYNLSIDEARKNTDKVLDMWKQNTTQLDDMLMVTFKITYHE